MTEERKSSTKLKLFIFEPRSLIQHPSYTKKTENTRDRKPPDEEVVYGPMSSKLVNCT